MKQEYQDLVLRACGASSLRVGAKIQTLWSGYGEIVRLHLEGCDRPSVVVKHVKFPEEAQHPGGWNTDRSHMRKVRSYQVETHWYQNYSTNPSCRIPACLAACSHGDEMLIVLEDLDVAGYDQRRYDHRTFCVKYWEVSEALQSLGHQMNEKSSKFLLVLCILAFLGAGKRKFENICVCKTSTLGEQQGRSSHRSQYERRQHPENKSESQQFNLTAI